MVTMNAARSPDHGRIVRDLAEALIALHRLGLRDRALYDDLLSRTLQAHPALFAIWSVWEPQALDGSDHDYVKKPGHDVTGRFVPLWTRGPAGLCVEPNLGYESSGIGDYYLVPKLERREVFFEPYEYRPLNGPPRWITSHVVPLVQGQMFLGVVGFDLLAPEQSGVRHGEHLRYSGSIQDKALSVLTKRELEVLHWLGEAKSNGEIAVILGISAHTVKHHLEKIYAKLGVENRHAAMLLVLPHR
jgi:DNA-binding CsgD family transcriptional regulator